MVEALRADVAAAAEWGHHQHRHAEAEPDRPADALGGVRERSHPQELAVRPARRDRGRDVVEEPAVLVPRHEQRGLRPQVGVARERLQDQVGRVLAPLDRRGRVFALRDRSPDPRHLGELAARAVRLEARREVV